MLIMQDTLHHSIVNMTKDEFNHLALEVFHHQAKHNELYRAFLDACKVNTGKIKQSEDIVFMPISFFKQHTIKTGSWDSEKVFSSSSTTGTGQSFHHLKDASWYEAISQLDFEYFYGPLENYCFLALLPAYLERTGSSLVYMADYFIRKSKHGQSGFFLNDLKALSQVLKDNIQNNVPTVLLGVSFALWDLAEQFPQDLSNLIVMETGGMKGRRQEITREALHSIFKQAFALDVIHSEYGMTELFSQAYSRGNGLFYPSPSMKVLTRELNDPFTIQKNGKTGGVNIIDLANVDTISFIATDDLGRVFDDGSFEILGRRDASEIRGCNLMVQDI